MTSGFPYSPTAVLRHYAFGSHPDQRTSMADARIGICLARGVAMEDIDPSSGYDHSRRAYDTVRRSWVELIEQHGFSEFYEGPGLAEVMALWTRCRPEFTAGDDWLSDGIAAHRTRWAGIGRPCNRESCDLH